MNNQEYLDTIKQVVAWKVERFNEGFEMKALCRLAINDTVTTSGNESTFRVMLRLDPSFKYSRVCCEQASALAKAIAICNDEASKQNAFIKFFYA